MRTLLIADREELSVPVEEEAKVHLHRKVVRAVGKGAETRRELALPSHLEAGAPNGDQVATEIATVDRRDVCRLEHPQGVQIVPVVEVAAEPAHALERSQRQLEPAGHILGGNETEV